MMALLVLFGCRAFSPETPRVNKAPETFIIGAPVEHGGGYYHFHLYWLGTDADGKIEKFVWAITDTTIQLEETVLDEEDSNFNPALNASSFDIAHWTTRTDSIFDFTINQGTAPSVDMTFHIVAMDDYGDYDRTPARLHFFSNTLGTPEINFYRVEGDEFIPIGSDRADKVGFGKPYTLAWSGTTPNIRSYDPDALYEIDLVEPRDDGLLGYKWQLGGDLGGNCVPSLEDCWHPRKLNEATGDSFSYFGTATQLHFANDGSGIGPFAEQLPSGTYNFLINSIDVAGVEVAQYLRSFQLQVNFDPETILLDYEVDWAHPDASDADQIYPYYILLKDREAGLDPVKYPFRSGDRVPDRSYVVFKALGRDSAEDIPLDPSFQVGFTGFVKGETNNFDGGNFTFATQSSPVNYNPPAEWAANAEGWSADTLGFMVSPRTEFVFSMQSEDEHGRRDASPAEFSFSAGFPPCLQCIELLLPDDVSAFDADLECYEPGDVGHACMDGGVINFGIKAAGVPALPGREYLPSMATAPVGLVVNNTSHEVKIVDDPNDPLWDGYTKEVAKRYRFKALIHGRDHLDEQWMKPMYRILGMQFQVDYEGDPNNTIVDCGGPDLIRAPLGGTKETSPLQTDSNWAAVFGNASNLQMINPQSGLWELRIDIVVPDFLFTWGRDNYRDIYLPMTYGEAAPWVYEQIIAQYGNGSVRALILDQASNSPNAFPRPRPVFYRYFNDVRPNPDGFAGDVTWRHEVLDVQGDTALELLRMTMESGPSSEGSEIPTKLFNVVVHGNGWSIPE